MTSTKPENTTRDESFLADMATIFDLLAKYDQSDSVVSKVGLRRSDIVLLAPQFRKWQWIPEIHQEAVSESSKNTG